MISRFTNRLHKIGVSVKLHGNIPWVYLKEINGVRVTEKYKANHGFTAFFVPVKAGQSVRFSNRREVFKLIRKYLER